MAPKRGPKRGPRTSSKTNRFLIKFWPILEPSWAPSWEPCWAKMGSLSFAKLLFWHFWTFLKSMNFETFFGRPSRPSWDCLGAILAPYWEGFGGQNRCQHRPQRKCQNWAPVEARIKNSRFGGHRKTSKIALKASYRTSTLKDAKIIPKSGLNGPKKIPKRAQRKLQNST